MRGDASKSDAQNKFAISERGTTERDYVIPARARPEGLDFFGKFAFFRGVPGRTGHAAEAC